MAMIKGRDILSGAEDISAAQPWGVKENKTVGRLCNTDSQRNKESSMCFADSRQLDERCHPRPGNHRAGLR